MKLKLYGTAITGKPPEQLIQEAINDLDRLLKFNKSVERLCLLGSAYKRKAWIAPGPQRKESLAKMARYFREAQISNEKHRLLDSFPTLNLLAAEILLGWYGGTPEVSPADLKGLCEQLRAYAVEMYQQEPNFRNSITMPECDLILALAGNTLNEQKRLLVDAYRHAMKH